MEFIFCYLLVQNLSIIKMKIQTEKVAWHSLKINEVLKLTAFSENGLSDWEVKKRQQEFGKNKLPEKKPISAWQIFYHQFLNPLIYVLLIAAVVAYLVGDVKDAFFILLVILINACLGTFQEWKAEKNTSLLKNLMKSFVKVKRSGQLISIDSEELVPGDLVYLESGVKVPADLRLISLNGLVVEEAVLTGESVAVAKFLGEVPVAAVLGERFNMLFAGTTVVKGRAEAVVVNTALNTALGNIAQAVMETTSEKPPLIVRMEKFSKQISLVVLLVCGLLAINSWVDGLPWNEVIMFSIALAVAAIPESLPIALTVVLSIATSRMAKRNVIVRKLAAVESLGSCTVIASDKTGTLTMNKQTVKTVFLPDGVEIAIPGEGFEVLKVPEKNATKIRALAKAGVMANEAKAKMINKKWEFSGDTVDIAMLVLALKADIDLDNQSAKTLLEIPYESELKMSAKLVEEHGKVKLYAKGAVESLIALGSKNGDLIKKSEQLARQGYRVLAVGEMEYHGKAEDFALEKVKTLEITGLVGMVDPLRVEAKESVKKCLEAGVRVVMITGDHPATALSIGKDLGIVTGEQDVITGAELDNLGGLEVPEYLKKIDQVRVFARVTPVQKLQIVEALVKLGHFVAVTGDGVNDAPALKKANIGLAMGSGTDVAKESASIVVVDDNFKSIEGGIEEGRFAYDNIRKITYLVLTTSFAEILLFALTIIAGLPLPLLPVQLLWLNLVTNGIRDIGLAFEAGESDVMQRKPRSPKENIVNKRMIQQVLISGVIISITAFFLFEAVIKLGYGDEMARNVLLLYLTIALNFHTFNCRSERKSIGKTPLSKNWYVVILVLFAQLLHILAMYFPWIGDVLKVKPVSGEFWLWTILLSVPVVLAMEIYKFWFRKKVV